MHVTLLLLSHLTPILPKAKHLHHEIRATQPFYLPQKHRPSFSSSSSSVSPLNNSNSHRPHLHRSSRRLRLRDRDGNRRAPTSPGATYQRVTGRAQRCGRRRGRGVRERYADHGGHLERSYSLC